MKKRINRGNERSVSRGIIYGVISFFIFLLLTSFVMACVINNTKNPSGRIEVFALAALLISGAFNSFLTSKVNSSNGIICASVSALASVAIMFAITAIINRGHLTGMILMNYLCLILVSVLFAFLGKRRSMRRKRH